MNGAARRDGIDAMRFIGFCGVVAIHTRADTLTRLAAEFGWFAVPFFFTVTGYFLYPLRSGDWKRDARDKLARILLPFAIFLPFYMVLGWTLGIWTPQWPQILLSLLTGEPGFHLWFLPSMAIAVALVMLLDHYLSHVQILLIGILLYAATLFLGPYETILFDPAARDWMPGIGPFTSVFFVAAGVVIRDIAPQPKFWVWVIAAILALLASIGEFFLIVGPLEYRTEYGVVNVRLSMIFLGLSMFMVALSMPDGGITHWLARLGQHVLSMYLIHVAIIWAFKAVNVQDTIPPVLFTTLIIVSSVLAAFALDRTFLRAVLQPAPRKIL